MRRFFITLTVVGLMAVGAVAQHNVPLSRTMSLRSLSALNAKHECTFKVSTNRSGKAESNSNVKMPADGIMNTPSGTLYKNMYGAAHGYVPENAGYVYAISSDGTVVDGVKGNDGFFYIRNPFSTAMTKGWVKGSLKKGTEGGADTVIVNLPQYVGKLATYEGDSIKCYAQSLHLTFNADLSVDATVNTDNTIKFSWDGDTLKMLGKEVLGLTNEQGQWLYLGDDSMVIHTLKDKPTTPPASASNVKYSMLDDRFKSAATGSIIDAKRDGNDIYLNVFYKDLSFWEKGSIEGDKVIFDKQYLGIDEKNGYHIYYLPVHVESVWDEKLLHYEDTYTLLPKLEYNYDANTGKMETTDAFMLNTGENNPTSQWIFPSTKLRPWEDVAYQPQNPVMRFLMPYDNQRGWGRLDFILWNYDADGNVLDTGKFYYKVYFDGKEFTFTTDKYQHISEDMTEVPYDFTDNFDFQSNGPTHTIFFYSNDFNKIGVQAIYKGGNETKVSDVVYYENTSSINDVNAKSETKTDYYDLSGRKIDEPSKGIFIKTIKYHDGTVKNIKVIK